MQTEKQIPNSQNKRYLLSELVEGLIKIEQHGGFWHLSGLPDQVVIDLDSCADGVQNSTIAGLRSLGSLLVWADFLDEPGRQDYTMDAGFLIQLLADVFEVSKQVNNELFFIRDRCKKNPDGTWHAPKEARSGRKAPMIHSTGETS